MFCVFGFWSVLFAFVLFCLTAYVLCICFDVFGYLVCFEWACVLVVCFVFVCLFLGFSVWMQCLFCSCVCFCLIFLFVMCFVVDCFAFE